MTPHALDPLARRLRVGLSSPGLCLACLSIVAFADANDEAGVRREVRRMAGWFWLEGFGDEVALALERAVRDGLDGAAEALRDLEARSCRADIFDAVVRRLARELREHERRSYAASLN